MFKSLLVSLKESLGLAYWVMIQTKSPECTYYFGPFGSEGEADESKGGYIDDLTAEGAEVVTVEIRQRRKPEELTSEAAPLGQ